MFNELSARNIQDKSLFTCTAGSRVVITKVSMDKTLLLKLFDLGLRLNREISVLHRASNGSMIIAVGGSRMAIDSRLTRQMSVQAA